MNCEEPTKVTEQPLSAGVWDRRLIVRAASPPEHERFDAQMRDHHYLGAGQPVGDYLRQVVERGGQPVALLAWGPACDALKDRDRWIGWSATTRVERLSLIVQNRRFLLLGAKGAEPNLASEVLAATARALPEQWLERFGYRPLLAETFTDPEAYHGACYKASAWEPVGASQGYERHRADFYREHGQPKRLWLRVLHPSAKALLRAADPALPEECRGGLRRAHAGTLPGALALDAKFIRDAVGVLSLVEADTGAPVALAVVDQKQNTPRSEQARAGQLLATAPLDERIVTGDALHATREQARSIVERGGEYVLQIKGIQPHLDTLAQSARRAAPPFLS